MLTEFTEDINELWNYIGNNIRMVENMLHDDQPNADILAFLQDKHAKAYKKGTKLGLVFDEANGVELKCRKCD